MIFGFAVVLVVGYAMAASWSMGRGFGRLWLTASVALLLVLTGSVALGRYFAVPSLSRLLIYAGALTGPIVLVPTVMLCTVTPGTSPWSKAFPTAIFGACVGLVCGFVIVVFGLGVW